MASDWIIAGAAIVNLLVVAVLALVTKSYADETKRIAKAAHAQAEATQRLADGAFRPILVAKAHGHGEYDKVTDVLGITFDVTNIGSAPALNVRAEVEGRDGRVFELAPWGPAATPRQIAYWPPGESIKYEYHHEFVIGEEHRANFLLRYLAVSDVGRSAEQWQSSHVVEWLPTRVEDVRVESITRIELET